MFDPRDVVRISTSVAIFVFLLGVVAGIFGDTEMYTIGWQAGSVIILMAVVYSWIKTGEWV